MNDMPKLFQGDIEGAKSPQSLIREYESFFYKHIGSLKEYHLQKAEEVEAKTYLCQIFQVLSKQFRCNHVMLNQMLISNC